MKYIKSVSLSSYDLRALCIERKFYTCGDNEEYDNLFRMLRDANGDCGELTDALIQSLAEDIKAHSDTDYEVCDIMTAIASKCHTDYEEA